MQRPAFIRRTKHVHAGHEDAGYSYVVIRRQPRPTSHFVIDSDDRNRLLSDTPPKFVTDNDSKNLDVEHSRGSSESERLLFEDELRVKAYNWARIVYPPMKRSGHVILDSCTSEGKNRASIR